MTETRFPFNDGNAYDRYMGRWSRAIGEKFLAWLAAPANRQWLDVGCGTGAFTDIEASQTFRDFEDYWTSQTATFPHPVAKSAAALGSDDRERLRDILRTALPAAADGTITYSSRATAFKARKPR